MDSPYAPLQPTFRSLKRTHDGHLDGMGDGGVDATVAGRNRAREPRQRGGQCGAPAGVPNGHETAPAAGRDGRVGSANDVLTRSRRHVASRLHALR